MVERKAGSIAQGSTSAAPAVDLALSNKFLDCLTSSWAAAALHVFAELKIADHLEHGPKSIADLAALTNCHAASLHRLLRALTTIDICNERTDGNFELTPMGALLIADSPNSLHAWTIWWGTNLWQVFGNLLYSVKTGQSARKMLTGKDAFGHLEDDPVSAAIFNQALLELTRMIAHSVIQSYDFSLAKTIVDVGGGYGELLIAILQQYPKVNGILLDLPHTTAGAIEKFTMANLESRCHFVQGDFFASLPTDADIYLLKSILHDWNDEKCRQILEVCRGAMRKDARLLLIERILPDRLDTSQAHRAAVRSDLTMLAALGAKERSQTEFLSLLENSGFSLTGIIPLGASFNIIEAQPRQ